MKMHKSLCYGIIPYVQDSVVATQHQASVRRRPFYNACALLLTKATTDHCSAVYNTGYLRVSWSYICLKYFLEPFFYCYQH